MDDKEIEYLATIYREQEYPACCDALEHAEDTCMALARELQEAKKGLAALRKCFYVGCQEDATHEDLVDGTDEDGNTEECWLLVCMWHQSPRAVRYTGESKLHP